MSRREEIPQPRRRWRFGPRGPEEIVPPPASPEEAPSFDSAAIMREAEAHFTPGPEGEEEETLAAGPDVEEEAILAPELDVEEDASCRPEAILPPEESGTHVQ